MNAAASLLQTLPLKRAAYSDRTALLMATMSQLAYLPFEVANEDRVGAALKAVQEAGADNEAGREALDSLVSDIQSGEALEGRQQLIDKLSDVKFELVNTYQVGETQAFLARRPAESDKEGSHGVLILAFRGTEKKAQDWKTDLRVNLAERDGVKVHVGFYDAFKLVSAQINRDLDTHVHDGDTVYLTGHSLGGALAVVATRMIANDSTGACYTFGQPMVGGYEFEDKIKTPIYRVVNAHDIVPRVPPGKLIVLMLLILSLVRFPGRGLLVRALNKLKGYTHIGDLRYLAPKKDAAGKVQLISNPSVIDRALWWMRDVFFAWDLARPVHDHSMSLYHEKLLEYAQLRNTQGTTPSGAVDPA